MSDLPILFSAPMVLAHIEARKSQTRRLLTPRMLRFFDGHGKSWQPSWEQLVLALEEAADFRRVDGSTWTWTAKAAPHQHAERTHWMADLHVAPGDRLWIRETWRTGVSLDAHKPTEIEKMVKEAGYRKPWCPVQYEADKASVGSVADFGGDWGKTRVAIHMPRWLSRLTDTVTDVRVQRLQEISEEDALAEGVVQARDRMFVVPGISHPNKDFGELARPTAREMYAALWDVINGSGAWLGNPWVVVTDFQVVQKNIDEVAL